MTENNKRGVSPRKQNQVSPRRRNDLTPASVNLFLGEFGVQQFEAHSTHCLFNQRAFASGPLKPLREDADSSSPPTLLLEPRKTAMLAAVSNAKKLWPSTSDTHLHDRLLERHQRAALLSDDLLKLGVENFAEQNTASLRRRAEGPDGARG